MTLPRGRSYRNGRSGPSAQEVGSGSPDALADLDVLMKAEDVLAVPGQRTLIVICAGGQAGELASYVRALQQLGEPISIAGFVDDYLFDTSFEGAPVLGGVTELGVFLQGHANRDFSYLTAVGNNRERADLVQRITRLAAQNLTPWTLQHPAAVVGDAVTVGTGTCIGPGAVITTHVVIGDHCVLNINSSISHSVTLGSYVYVGPGASICSGAVIEDGCQIGAGATVAKQTQVGEWSVIAPGAVVTDDVPSRVTVSGAPARIVQRHSPAHRRSLLVG